MNQLGISNQELIGLINQAMGESRVSKKGYILSKIFPIKIYIRKSTETNLRDSDGAITRDEEILEFHKNNIDIDIEKINNSSQTEAVITLTVKYASAEQLEIFKNRFTIPLIKKLCIKRYFLLVNEYLNNKGYAPLESSISESILETQLIKYLIELQKEINKRQKIPANLLTKEFTIKEPKAKYGSEELEEMLITRSVPNPLPKCEVEQIEISKISKKIQTVDDAMYIIDLIYQNKDNKEFIGSMSNEIFELKMKREQIDATTIGEYYFVKKFLSLGYSQTIEDYFEPQLTQAQITNPKYVGVEVDFVFDALCPFV